MNPEDFKALVAAGLDTNQIVLVMEMMDRDAKKYAEAEDARKSKGRERIAKWRLERSNVTVQLQKVTERLTGAGVQREEDISNLQVESKEESKKQNAAVRDVVEFKEKLEPHVEADLLDAFVKVRKAKRAANTGYAAGLFIADAAKCGMTVSEAATECVRSSWITVKPEYFQGRQRAGPAPPKPNPMKEAAARLMEKLDAASSETQANPTYLRLVALSGNG